MKKVLRSFIVIALGIFAAAPAFAAGSFDCGYSAAEIQKVFLAYYDPNGRYYISRQNDEQLVIEREIDPSSVRTLMPRIRLPKRNPYDPFEPERWDYAPVFSAVDRITVSCRVTTQNMMRTSIREDTVANPNSPQQVIVEEDTSAFYVTSRYLNAYLNGGVGAGLTTYISRGRHYVDEVLDGSSAALAGVRPGDRIMHINKTNGDDVMPMQFATKYAWSDSLGKPFTLDLASSNGERREVSLTCDYIPAQVNRLRAFLGTDDILPGRTREQVEARYQRWVPSTKEAQRQQQQIAAMPFEFDDNGVITKVHKGSVAEKAGLVVGDTIVEVNLKPVRGGGAAEARDTIARRLGGKLSVVLSVRKKGARGQTVVTLRNQ